MQCVVCDKPIGKKARTCSPTCRSKLARSVASSVASSVAQPSVASPVGPSVATPNSPADLWPRYRWSNDSDYVMTDYEREHYKPAHELDEKKHERNPVSLPGDAHYNGVCLGEKYKDRWIA